jgi:hypothetical protein
MRISVKVTPNAKSNELVELVHGNFKAKITAPAEGGRANAELVRLLTKKFGVPTTKVRIVRGLKDRNKVIEVSS